MGRTFLIPSPPKRPLRELPELKSLRDRDSQRRSPKIAEELD